MSAHILERSLTNVVTAVKALPRDVSCSSTRGHTLERNPTSVHSAKRNSAAGRLNKHMVTHEQTKQNNGTKRKVIENDSDDSDCDFADEIEGVREEDRAERLASLRSSKN